MTKPTNDLLDPSDAANYLAVARQTLAIWRSTGRYQLPYHKVGKKILYRRSDLDAWLQSRRRLSGGVA